MNNDTPVTLIEALQNRALYDHPVERFEVVETHISWVLLTGPYAYKIKKPVNLGFLDFSTLDKRRFYCREELRLNRRLARELYVDVVVITGSVRAPILGGSGPAIDYAVKMRQFPREAQLDRILARGALTAGHIDALAREIAEFHRRAVIAGEGTPFGEPERIAQPVRENVLQLRERLSEPGDRARIDRLEAWTEAAHAALRVEFESRKRDGFVRECHGDMHLANIAWIDGRAVIFDCIEFSESLRWIDVMSEVAFLTMDLDDRGAPQLARRALNTYLEQNGEYAGLRVLRFYQVYRATVRAKVACIRMDQAGASDRDRERLRRESLGYLDLAERYTRPTRPALIITHGLSGSGKTTLTQALVDAWGAVRVRSDVERKRLFGLAPDARTASDVASGVYGREAGERTYARLADLAQGVLGAGYSCIVDAAFLQRAQRALLREVAAGRGVPFAILDVRAPEAALRSRILARERESRDASEADLAVLGHQLATLEPIGPDEGAEALTVETEPPPDLQRLIAALDRMTGS
ncbi:MAG: AAA family ATPase [Nitrospirae bacterium]|nr:AAA family ATPase [Nitrospirota bacterium]